MDIADKMKEPGKIVRLEGIRTIGGENVTEKRDAVLDIGNGNSRQRRAVGRERCVDKMPIFVHEHIVITGVASWVGAAIGTIASIAAVRSVGFVALDLVRPSGGNHENQKVLVSRRCIWNLLIDCGFPFGILRIHFQEDVDAIALGGFEFLVGNVSHGHMAAIVPGQGLFCGSCSDQEKEKDCRDFELHSQKFLEGVLNSTARMLHTKNGQATTARNLAESQKWDERCSLAVSSHTCVKFRILNPCQRQTEKGHSEMANKRGMIGILTGGGDVPGLNPAIRGVTLRALHEGYEVIGIRHGWAGLVETVRDKGYDNSDNFLHLNEEIVDRAGRTGGTFLHSSRTNPGRVSKGNVPGHLKDKFNAEKNDLTPEVLKNLEWLGINTLVPIGGDDTLSYGVRLHKEGFKVIGIPKTMDNDVPGTD